MDTLFTLVMPQKALSYGARGKAKYQRRLADEARANVKGILTNRRLYSKLYSKVYYFHRGRRPIDADNISKPILDALNGVVYEDDSQVVLRMVVKIALDVDTYELVQVGVTSDVYERLLALLTSREDVLYVEIGSLDEFHLNLGIF